MPQDLYPVKPHIAERAHLNSLEEYQRLYRLSLDNPEWFWGEQAKALELVPPLAAGSSTRTTRRWTSRGSRAAASTPRSIASTATCPRWATARRSSGRRTSWASTRYITYRELKHQVCRLANVLLSHGVRKGDRVCIYLTMVPQLVYAMLACARIGAVHSVVFGGFSAESLRDRIVDARCKLVVTANEGLRGGRRVPLKKTVDRAVEGMSMVQTVLVARRTDGACEMKAGRDVWLEEECHKQRSTCTNEWMGAEDPLFILYTSGSTGKPKGLLHTTGGYLVYAAFTHRLVFDYHPGDVFFCAADVGWITGHSYIVYGPLANGATTVLFESTPVYPDPGRYWRVVDDLSVNIFYTAPTALRASPSTATTRSSGTAASRCASSAPSANRSTPRSGGGTTTSVGDGRCAVVDTWWQTETGGILITPLPGVTPTKPGSATLPFFGVKPVIVDPETGETIEGNGVDGRAVPGHPLAGPGAHASGATTSDSARPTSPATRATTSPATGRAATRTATTGSPAGSTTCSTCRDTGSGRPRWRARSWRTRPWPRRRWSATRTRSRARAIYAYVLLNADYANGDHEQLVGALKQQVRHVIGAFAAPDIIHIASGLPKTRSGKIMRRILRKVAASEYTDLGDLTTLAEPDVVEQLIEEHKAQAGASPAHH